MELLARAIDKREEEGLGITESVSRSGPLGMTRYLEVRVTPLAVDDRRLLSFQIATKGSFYIGHPLR